MQTVAIILVCDFFLGSATFYAPNLNSIQLVVQYDARLFLYAHIAWRTHEWNQTRWLLWRRDKVWWINLLHAVLLCLLVYLLTIVAGSSLQYHYALRLFSYERLCAFTNKCRSHRYFQCEKKKFEWVSFRLPFYIEIAFFFLKHTPYSGKNLI